MSISRRDFPCITAAVASSVLAIQRGAHAAGSDILRVGVVGCGSRGAGAASIENGL